MGDTVRGSGHAGNVRDTCDRACGLSVGRDAAIDSVGSREVLVLALAGLEGAIDGVVGSVIGATNTIEDVLAVVVSIRASRVAGLEAEEVVPDEIVPLNNLISRSSEHVAIHNTSHRVTAEVSTVGVHLAPGIDSKDVDRSLVNEADSLDVVRSPHELHALQGIRRDQTCAMNGLGAVCDHDALNVSDFPTVLGWSPKTKVVDGVEVRSLTERVLSCGGSIANVVPVLVSTDETDVRVDTVRKVGRCREPL